MTKLKIEDLDFPPVGEAISGSEEFEFKGEPGEGDYNLPPLPSTEFSAEILKKVNYTHDAIIDEIIANPGLSQIELGKKFGYSKQWISRLLCSDAFQARLAVKKDLIVSPMLTATVEERIRGLTLQSIDVIEEKLYATRDPKIALKALEISTKAAAYGARTPGGINITQNSYVVALPEKIQDSGDWAEKYRPAARSIEGEFQEVKDE